MQHRSSRSVVFFGTPEFAVPSLEALVNSGFTVRLVVTAPDRPKGRGLQLTQPPVKVVAQRLGLKVFQPQRLKTPETIAEILAFKPDVLVVVAYGKLIPPELFRSVPFGALNVHPSLLPKYRGPAPIQRAILAGDEITGVTIMLIDDGLDSGPILSTKTIAVKPYEAAGELSERLALEGADLLVEALREWLAGKITPQPQNDSSATFAPAIEKGETRLDFEQGAHQVINRCRAFDPIPGAYTSLQGKRIKCFGAKKAPAKFPDARPGEIVGVSEEGLLIRAGDGETVAIGFLQMEGKKKLPAKEFVKGLRNIIGLRLGD